MHVKKFTVENILNIKIKHFFTVLITFFLIYFFIKKQYTLYVLLAL